MVSHTVMKLSCPNVCFGCETSSSSLSEDNRWIMVKIAYLGNSFLLQLISAFHADTFPRLCSHVDRAPFHR